MGFSKIVSNLDEEGLKNTISNWVSLVEDTAKKYGISFQLISDTVFAYIKKKDDLMNLVSFARDLLEKGCKQSFLLRGAIVPGKFNWNSKLIYGEAVIDAHILEQKQQWLGTILFDFNLNSSDYMDLDLICYPVPMKNSEIKLFPAINWNIPPHDDLIVKFMSGGLTQKGEPINWDLGEKISNTLLFKQYVEELKKLSGSPEKFIGLFPISRLLN
ncbi:hypothetical protein [Legionella jamestowniensis]|uniref:hypothetical protein n=1 Tax=Legionella jamestowniensis TaxID=455 RepID=UPI0010418388|nr:hypothetical protein [Legionella jamestowniensis]